MIVAVAIGSMIIYAVGVMTGAYIGYSIRKETSVPRRKPAPNEADRNKILELLKTKSKIINNDVEELLNISDATATRYLDRLEETGDIVQQGNTGRNVFYILK
jgi:predicted HTH transcriptional regulator